MTSDLLQDTHVEAGGPREILRRVFGFNQFRGLQEEAIAQVVGGGDALVLMPTGGGKSVCYQVPALCRPGTAIVVSPLIALMDDQVAALRQLGIAAGAMHSELEPDEQRRIGRELDAGRLDLLYVSPERLLSPGTMERLQRLEIALLAIDEAHCVSQWGHEFRPEYRELACLPQCFPGVPRIALTATADPRTRLDILHALDMDDARVFTASFHRPNLHIAAEAKVGETAQLLALLRRHEGEAGIVYCGSRNKTERIAAWLGGKGIAAVAFHAGLPPEQKRAARHAVSFRRGGGGGGHDRLRHGDRPARRAVRGASRHARQPGGVLPTDRPRRPRRRSRGHAAAVWRRGHRPGALLPAGLRRARNPEAGDAHPPGGDDPADRDGRVPHPVAAGLLRRDAGAAMRALRQLRRPGRRVRRHHGCAEGAVGDLSHRPALRRAARGRRADGQGERRHRAMGARQAADLRRRRRPQRRLLARRDPGADRPWGRRRRHRPVRHHQPGDGQGPPDPARRGTGDAARGHPGSQGSRGAAAPIAPAATPRLQPASTPRETHCSMRCGCGGHPRPRRNPCRPT